MTDDEHFGYGICTYCGGVLQHEDDCVREVGIANPAEPAPRGLALALYDETVDE